MNTRQYSTQNETREIFYWNNKTGSFLPLQLTNNNVDDNYSSIAFDEDGYTHIGWERRDASNLFQLIYTNNRATGDTFNLPVWITSGGINKATPYMAMGKGDSSVHFAYLTYPMTGTGNAIHLQKMFRSLYKLCALFHLNQLQFEYHFHCSETFALRQSQVQVHSICN